MPSNQTACLIAVYNFPQSVCLLSDNNRKPGTSSEPSRKYNLGKQNDDIINKTLPNIVETVP